MSTSWLVSFPSLPFSFYTLPRLRQEMKALSAAAFALLSACSATAYAATVSLPCGHATRAGGPYMLCPRASKPGRQYLRRQRVMGPLGPLERARTPAPRLWALREAIRDVFQYVLVLISSD